MPCLNSSIVEVTLKRDPTAHRSQRWHWRGQGHGICTFPKKFQWSNGDIEYFSMHTKKQSVTEHQEKYPCPVIKLLIK